MPIKNRDAKNRWRCKTIAFRVSPEENEAIERRVYLSGLSKQEYLIRRSNQQEIVVNGNPRVYKALRTTMEEILEELRRIDNASEIDEELTETIKLVAHTFEGMGKEDK